MMMRGALARPAISGVARMSRIIWSVIEITSCDSTPTPATLLDVVAASA